MGYKQKQRKTDLDNKGISQYFNDSIDDYEPQRGEQGASYTIINALSEDGTTRIPLKVNADGELVTVSKLTGSIVKQNSLGNDATVVTTEDSFPTDLQNHMIPDDNPIPFKRAGKNVEQIAKVVNISVAAGATYNIPKTDVSAYKWVSVGVLPDASHTYKVTANLGDETDDYQYNYSILDSSAAARRMSAGLEIKHTHVTINLTNQDSVSRTYTIAFFGGKY